MPFKMSWFDCSSRHSVFIL